MTEKISRQLAMLAGVAIGRSVIGALVEVPALIALVQLALYFRRRFFPAAPSPAASTATHPQRA